MEKGLDRSKPRHEDHKTGSIGWGEALSLESLPGINKSNMEWLREGVARSLRIIEGEAPNHLGKNLNINAFWHQYRDPKPMPLVVSLLGEVIPATSDSMEEFVTRLYGDERQIGYGGHLNCGEYANSAKIPNNWKELQSVLAHLGFKTEFTRITMDFDGNDNTYATSDLVLKVDRALLNHLKQMS